MRKADARPSRRRAACCGAVTVALSWAALPARAADPAPDDRTPPAPATRAPSGRVPKVNGPYKIQPGDELEISVLPHTTTYDFNFRGRVLPDGMIYLKNLRQAVKAGGMTIPELTQSLTDHLKQDVKLRNPQVSISIPSFADQEKKPESLGKITVAGAVGHQGPLDLEEGLRLKKAIDLAGALKDADLKHVKLVHKDLRLEVVDLSTDDRITNADLNKVLQDGDSINIPSLRPEKEVPDTVHIDGAVTNPAPYPLDPAKLVTLQDLIQAAGKLTPLADYRKVELRRKGEPDRVYNLEDLDRKGLQGKVELKPGDEVFVPTQGDRVFLLGSVPKPGAYAVKPGERIASFLFSPDNADVAGALGTSADLEHVQVIRQGQESIQVNLKSVIKSLSQKEKNRPGLDKNNVALQPGDAILILPRNDRQRRSPLEYLGQLGGLAGLFAAF